MSTGLLEAPGPVRWLEVHAENYMGARGVAGRWRNCARWPSVSPISVHGVGLSIGGERPLDRDHLARLRHLFATGWNPAQLFRTPGHGRPMTPAF